MPEDKPFYLTQNEGFAPIDASADLLHPEQNKAVKVNARAVVETQYFGFSVPEAGIHAIADIWHRPNIHLVMGGIWVWRGIKQCALQAELCDLRTFADDSALENDLHEYRLENGYGVKILEPLKRFHITYADPVRDSSVDLISEAIAPAVMYGDGNHFEQAMHVTGKLVLRGKAYEVDCFNIRDRSWGKPRSEEIVPAPPIAWMTGVFSENFSFNCTMFDQASGNPELTGQFALPEEKTLNGGWIYRDGKVGCILRAKKRVARIPASLLPAEIELEAADEFGRTVQLRGTLVSSCLWQVFANCNVYINLMRWECESQVAYGDCQEAMWNDYYNFMATR